MRSWGWGWGHEKILHVHMSKLIHFSIPSKNYGAVNMGSLSVLKTKRDLLCRLKQIRFPTSALSSLTSMGGSLIDRKEKGRQVCNIIIIICTTRKTNATNETSQSRFNTADVDVECHIESIILSQSFAGEKLPANFSGWKIEGHYSALTWGFL